MLGKNQAEIFLRYYEQILSNFLSFHTVSYYLPSPQWVLSSLWLWLNLRKCLLFPGSPRAENLLRQKPLIPSIPFHPDKNSHSIMPSFCWQKSNLWLSMETLLLLLTKSPNARKFCFSCCSLFFFSFFRFRFLVYLFIYLLFIHLFIYLLIYILIYLFIYLFVYVYVSRYSIFKFKYNPLIRQQYKNNKIINNITKLW